MRRKLNGRLLLALIVGVALLGAGVHLLHGAQVRRNARALLDLSRRAEAEGRLDKAEDYLSRYLIFRPTDADQLARQADLATRRVKGPEGWARAARIYAKLLRVAPDHKEAPKFRRELGRLYVELEQFPEAREQLGLLDEERHKDGELSFLLGRCDEGLGQTQEAAAWYAKAIEQRPEHVESYVRQAELLRTQLNNPKKADELMGLADEEEGVVAKTGGQSAEAYLARARYRDRFAAGRDANTARAQSDADIARALKLAPTDGDVLLAAAAAARSRRDYKGAVKLLRDGLAHHPDNALMYQAQAEALMLDGRPEEAVDVLKGAIEKLPDENSLLRWTLAETYIQKGEPGDLDAAGKVIEDLKKSQVRPALLGYLEGRAEMGRKRWAAAARTLAAVEPELVAAPELKTLAKRALVMLGECYERLGNVDQQHDAFRRAAAINLPEPDPYWVPARMGLAGSLVALNRVDDALAQYQIALRRELGAGIAMARLQIFLNLRRPDDERRWQEVDQTLDGLEARLRGQAAGQAAAEVAILRGESLALQGKTSAARQLLEQALKQQPEQVDLWVALANLSGREGRPERTLEVLDDAQRQLGPREELRLARIDYWARSGSDEAPKALARQEEEVAGLKDAGDRVTASRALAVAYGRIGRPADAERLWRRVAELRPEDLAVRLVLFDLTLRSGDLTAARAAAERIREIEGEDGSLWRYADARVRVSRVLLDRKETGGDPGPLSAASRSELAEARGRLVAVANRRPSWARAPLALAQVEKLSGNREAELKAYLRAVVDLGERSEAAVATTLDLLNKQGRGAEAEALLRKLGEERVPLSDKLKQVAAQTSFAAGDYGRALELAQQAISADVKDPAQLVWLGQLRMAAGQPAESMFRRALVIDRANVQAWQMLILHLAQLGQKEKAEAALSEAEAALAGDVQAPTALALAHSALGHKEKAEALYKEALAQSRKRAESGSPEGKGPSEVAALRALAGFYVANGRQKDADPLLDKIIEAGKATTDARWARQVKAYALARSGYKGSVKALEILGLVDGDEARTIKDASPEDLSLRARILASRPSRDQRQQAIATLEGLQEGQAASPADLALLAQLYDVDGKWTKAQFLMSKLIEARGSSPEHLVTYTRMLLRHQKPKEAAVYLKRAVAALKGEQPALVELEARILHAEGRRKQAVDRLRQLARDPKINPVAVALVLEQLGEDEAALELHRRAADRPDNPQGALTLAAFLGRKGRTREALDVLDKAWSTCPPAAVSNVSVIVLYAARADDAASFARVDRRLEQAARQHPEAVSIQFDIANLRSLQGRYDDAEKIFREICRNDRTNGAPLNNLAWLLALAGKPDQALELIGQAIDLEGETPDLLDTRALAHLGRGRGGDAVKDLQDAIAVSPTGDKFFHLAQAYKVAGREPEAADAFRQAKDKGLTADSLHPLERKAYNQLSGDLERR